MVMNAPSSYHHGDLRAAIIDTAIAIAEEDGLPALSVREIARRLGVSHAAPARHFANRAALLAGLATAAFSLFADSLERSGQSKPPGRECLAALGVAYIRFALRRPALFRLMFHPETAESAEAPDPALKAAGDRAFGVLASAVRETLGGDATDAEVESATLQAWSGAHGAAMLWLDGPLRGMGKRGFLQWADTSMAELSRSIVSRPAGR